MKATLEITAIETTGDGIKVTAQGSVDQAAEWRRLEYWSFTVPAYIGNRYRMGQKIRVIVK